MADMTALEMAKLIENPQAAKYANVFASAYALTGLLPYSDPISGFKYPFTLASRLPTVNPRDFMTDFTDDFGKHSTFDVEWKVYGARMAVDKALAAGSPMGAKRQEILQLQAVAKQMCQDFFQGKGGTSMVGLGMFMDQVAMFNGQRINAASTTSGGDALTLAMMDSALDQINADENTKIFTTKFQRQALTLLARNSASVVRETLDELGNKVVSYYGIPIYVMKDYFDMTDVLSSVEPDGQGSPNLNTSSVWCVKFGLDSCFAFGPESGALVVDQANPGTNFEVTRLESRTGIIMAQPGAAVRIMKLKSA